MQDFHYINTTIRYCKRPLYNDATNIHNKRFEVFLLFSVPLGPLIALHYLIFVAGLDVVLTLGCVIHQYTLVYYVSYV